MFNALTGSKKPEEFDSWEEYMKDLGAANPSKSEWEIWHDSYSKLWWETQKESYETAKKLIVEARPERLI